MIRSANRVATVIALAAGTLSSTALAGPYPLETLEKMLNQAVAQLADVEARIAKVEAEIRSIENAGGSASSGARPGMTWKDKARLSELKHELSKLYNEAAGIRIVIEWLMEQIDIAHGSKGEPKGGKLSTLKPGKPQPKPGKPQFGVKDSVVFVK